MAISRSSSTNSHPQPAMPAVKESGGSHDYATATRSRRCGITAQERWPCLGGCQLHLWRAPAAVPARTSAHSGTSRPSGVHGRSARATVERQRQLPGMGQRIPGFNLTGRFLSERIKDSMRSLIEKVGPRCLISKKRTMTDPIFLPHAWASCRRTGVLPPRIRVSHV